MTSSHRLRNLAAIGALALLFPSNGKAQGQFTGYENAFFGGSAYPYPLQAFAQARNRPIAFPGSIEDRITSLRWTLDPNVSLTFYENRDGSGRQYHIAASANRNGFDPNVGPTYNDTFSAFSWQLDDPTVSGTVTLHKDAGLGGTEKRLPLSSYDEGIVHELLGYNDEASSISWSLSANVVVTFFEHPDGTGREYTVRHSAPRNGSAGVLPSRYNDKFSSWRWDTVDPAQGFVYFYTDGGYTGYQLTRYVSEVGFNEVSFKNEQMNDQVDSFRWDLPLDTTILLYDKSPKGGACYSLTAAGQRDVRSSGIFHDKLSTFEVVRGDRSADFADRNQPYDRNTYLASHNAHVSDSDGWLVWNQNMSVFDQLEYGARCLQLDTLINNGTIYMVHGTWLETIAQRVPFSTPTTLAQQLTEIDVWMQLHPREVLTLIFENNNSPELANYLLDVSVIKDEIYIQERGTWPTANELLAMGKRYVVFETKDRNASSRINWQYEHTVENEFSSWQNPNRRLESAPIDRRHRSLYFMNNISPLPPSAWPPLTTPNTFSRLINLINANPQLPNYIGVDRISEGGEGGADVARHLNRLIWPLKGREATFSIFGKPTCGSRYIAARNRPVVGTSLEVEIGKVLNTAADALQFLIVGVSDTDSGGLSLPSALPIDPSCTLRVSPDVIEPTGSVDNTPVRYSVPIPLVPALLGTEVFFQGIGIKTSTPELVMSNAGRARLGSG